MGLSRDAFYRYKAAVEEGGVSALLDKGRRKPNLKNRVESEAEAAVVEYAIEWPAHGQQRASNELRKHDFHGSSSDCFRKKHEDEAFGEIETAHPGYLGSQDTFYKM